MNVKSFFWMAICVAMMSGTAQAQFDSNQTPFESVHQAPFDPADQAPFDSAGQGGAIRSATFGGPEGLGVIPVADTAPEGASFSALQLDNSGMSSSGACGVAGCTDISCTSPIGCTSCGDIGCSSNRCTKMKMGPDACCPGPCRCCGPCGWMHKVNVFGEFLYLRARDSEIPYAVVQNSNLPLNQIAPIQVSPHGIVDPDWEPAFRAGFGVSLGSCSSLTVQYTMFESTSSNAITLGQTGFGVVGLVGHPGAQNTSSNSTVASAFYDISFDMIDADFRGLLSYGPGHRINYLIGASYGNLEQQFGARNINNGTETVFTDIDFDGAGIRLGLEGERFNHSRTMFTYGKAISTILAGEFDAVYYQGNDFDNSIVNTEWEAGRVVPVLELEAGFGWQLHDGAYRLTAGYNFSAWFNTVKTDDWIRSVQQNNLTGLGDTMTFDGLVARLEARF